MKGSESTLPPRQKIRKIPHTGWNHGDWVSLSEVWLLPSSPPDGRAPVSTMSLFHRSLWHLQKSDESQPMITDYCEPNWGGAPSQLPGNCCTYHAPIDREDLAGRVISNSSHSPGMNNSTFVILTQGHVNILMIKGLGLPGTSAETHSGLLYWWPL